MRKIADLPTEVLSIIFLSFNEDSASDAGLITLIHVCRQWRSIAIDYSHLWTRMFIKESDPGSKIKDWLQRSGNLPLDITVHPCLPRSTIQILNHLRPQTYRWRQLSITELYDYKNYKCVPRILTNLGCDQMVTYLPQLEALELRGQDAYDGATRPPSQRGLNFEAPRLKKFLLDSIRHDWSRLWISANQLTHLEIIERGNDRSYSIIMVNAISRFTNLQDLRLDLKDLPPQIGPEVAFPVVLPHLETFELILESCCLELLRWLTALTAHKLKYLKIFHHFTHRARHSLIYL